MYCKVNVFLSLCQTHYDIWVAVYNPCADNNHVMNFSLLKGFQHGTLVVVNIKVLRCSKIKAVIMMLMASGDISNGGRA